jgi:hypothetical protein
VYQVYTLDSNVAKGSRDCVVYKSAKRRNTDTQQQPSQPGSQADTLTGTNAELDTFNEGSISVPLSNPTRKRLSMCACYVCHEQLGADTTQRIGN